MLVKFPDAFVLMAHLIENQLPRRVVDGPRQDGALFWGVYICGRPSDRGSGGGGERRNFIVAVFGGVLLSLGGWGGGGAGVSSLDDADAKEWSKLVMVLCALAGGVHGVAGWRINEKGGSGRKQGCITQKVL